MGAVVWCDRSEKKIPALASHMFSLRSAASALVAAGALLAAAIAASDQTWAVADDGKAYSVRAAPGAVQVADRLAALQAHMAAFLDAADGSFAGDPRIARIRRRWDGTLSEVPPRSPDAAYSVSKGSVALCVRDPSGGDLEPFNASVFVLLHEFAHVATEEYGHTPAFWANFRALLEMASRTGHYAYEEYSASSRYCGQPLGVSPLTCVRRHACSAPPLGNGGTTSGARAAGAAASMQATPPPPSV